MENQIDLEVYYSPSKFSKRFQTSEEVIKNHCDFVAKETELNRKQVKCTLNIPYSNSSPRAQLDIYHNDLPQNAPLFVYIHGGFWQLLNKELSGYCVRPLVKSGYKVIIVGYELCPQVTLMQVVEQIKEAGHFIMKYAEDNGSRFVSFAGHSAGAHLATYLFTKDFYNSISNSHKIKSFYLIGGVYDLTDIRHLECTNKNNILSLTEQNIKHLSPTMNTTKFMNVNVKIIVGEYDTPKFQEQSYEFYEKLKKSIDCVEIILIEKYDHYNEVEDLAKDDYIIIQLIVNDLK